ncbi:MAG: hypothetical protein M0D57_10925 [Sphingobacteriales bacterium JAD_PAG50586_3]|nr:MAG: hypothetical protein M0D57_10925 [Sphingobacteriales bacterium JAD_PAG50586_3]
MKLQLTLLFALLAHTFSSFSQKGVSIGVSGGFVNQFSTINSFYGNGNKSIQNSAQTYTAGLDLGYSFNDVYTLRLGGNIFNFTNAIRFNNKLENWVPTTFDRKSVTAVPVGQLQITNDVVFYKKNKFSIAGLLGLNLNFIRDKTYNQPTETYSVDVMDVTWTLYYGGDTYNTSKVNFQLLGGLSFNYVLGKKLELFVSPKFYFGLNYATKRDISGFYQYNEPVIGAELYSSISKGDAVAAIAGLRFKFLKNIE